MAAVPNDYAFLKWVWHEVTNHCHLDGGALVEEYIKQTGEPNPYDESTEHLAALEDTFDTELNSGTLPRLVDYIRYENDDVLPSDAPLAIIKAAVGAVYGRDYAEGVLSRQDAVRRAARHADGRWDAKLGWCMCWQHRLEIEEDELVEVGTTRRTQLQDLGKEWEELLAIRPQQQYPIVCLAPGVYSYDTITRLSTLDDDWLVSAECLVKKGYVLGPFMFDSEEDAINVQNERVLRSA